MLQHRILSSFQCLGDKCEDTCCQTWQMQMDAETFAKYEREKPELLSAVETLPDSARCMKRDATTNLCVKLENGLCSIHRDYGAEFLGDACYFYPRATRKLGDTAVMSATLSCPEIARLALLQDNTVGYAKTTAPRLPQTIKDYLPEGLTPEQALAVHQAFLDTALAPDISAEHALARIVSVAHSLPNLPVEKWPQAVPFYLQSADGRMPAPETKAEDPFNLLHMLCGLMVSTGKAPSARLKETLGEMESALACTLDWQHVTITTTEKSLPALQTAQQRWQTERAADYAPLLKRFLAAQVALMLFPFGGLGANAPERAILLGVRFAATKLAWMCLPLPLAGGDGGGGTVRSVQSIARLLDHLGSADYLLKICTEAGWIKEARLRGLVG